MENNTPTNKDFQELISYLPKLYRKGFKPIHKWSGGKKNEDGIIIMPWPQYDCVVTDFFEFASKDCWTDDSSNYEETFQMIEDDKSIETADLTQIKQMLTYCVRGEKSCNGHWATVIKKGYLARLIQRLHKIQNGNEALAL